MSCPQTDQVEVAAVGADLLDDLLTQPSTLRQLTADGLSETFTLSLSEAGTTLRLEVIGDSAQQAVDTAARIVELAPGLLEESLGERSAESIAVEQAVVGSPEDATQADDGTYRYSTVIVVSAVPRGVNNPFPASLATVRSLEALARSIPFRIDVSQMSAGATFEVRGDVRETPLVDITVWAPTPEAALEAHQFIVARLRAELDALQASGDVAPESRTQMRTLVEASQVVATPTSQIRPVAVVVILGTGLAIALATVVEAIAADRRRRRSVGGGRQPGQVAETVDHDVPAQEVSVGQPFADRLDEIAETEPVVASGQRSRCAVP